MNRVFEQEVKAMVDRLILTYQPKKIIAFGSFARGEIEPDSDLDLCIIKEDIPLSPVERRFEVYRLLTHRKIPVDIVIYRPEEFETRLQLGDPFVKGILKDGKNLYG